MDFFPILSTLRRHRIATGLIVLEIALTCAIVSNSIFLIGDRLSRMDRPSGVTEDEVVRVEITGMTRSRRDAGAVTAQDLRALKGIPGVVSTAVANAIPFGGSSWNTGVSTIPDDPSPPVDAAQYMASPEFLQSLGVTVTTGRDFSPEDYVDFEAVLNNTAQITSVIITRGIADRLFPGKNPLGQAVYAWGKDPQRVIGVIEQLARPSDDAGAKNAAYAVIMPATMAYTDGGNYLLRVAPGRGAEVLAAVDAVINKVARDRIILSRQTFGEIRNDFFKQDRAMARLLVVICIALLSITALGIIGLTSFWVQQRTRQIGTRRALGATRGDIVRYFQTENFILSTLGILIGMTLGYVVNAWLMSAYNVPRMPGYFLPIGAALLWLLGQLAVLVPALRAATVSPAIATRTV